MSAISIHSVRGSRNVHRLRPSPGHAVSVSLLLGITLAARAAAAAGPPPNIVVSAPKPPILAPKPLVVRPPAPHPAVVAPVPRPMTRATTIRPPLDIHQARLSPPRPQMLAIPHRAPSVRRAPAPLAPVVSSIRGGSQLPQAGSAMANAHWAPLAFAHKTAAQLAAMRHHPNRGSSNSGAAQLSTRNQTDPRHASAQAQAAKLPPPDQSVALEPVSPLDLSSDGLQAETDVADGIAVDVVVTEQPEGSAQDSSAALQPEAGATLAQRTADEATLAALIVRRDQANAQFQQEVSAARARFANDRDLVAYQRASRSAQDALARRLAPILQPMARFNHTGMENGKLRVSDVARPADRAVAPVSTAPSRIQCGSAPGRVDDQSSPTAADVPASVCQHDGGSSSRAAPR